MPALHWMVQFLVKLFWEAGLRSRFTLILWTSPSGYGGQALSDAFSGYGRRRGLGRGGPIVLYIYLRSCIAVTMAPDR
jgi:hypothetical protein